MNVVNSLKKLYTSLGGNAETVKDVQTAPDMVDALADIAGSSIELPAVDAEDNGKVLKVANGKWAKGTDNSLPEVTSEDVGDVLTVNAEGAWAKAEPAKELPDVTATDNGSVLGVVNGAWAKTTPSGGTEIKTATFNAILSSGASNATINIVNLENNAKVIGARLTEESLSNLISNGIKVTMQFGYSKDGSTHTIIPTLEVEFSAGVITTGVLNAEVFYIK